METSLSDPISAECPCGPDLEYDPEYLLLFTRAAPREEAQYGDFVSTPETINWAELERDARRLLMRSKDIRILVVLLRCRIQQAGAQGLADALAALLDHEGVMADIRGITLSNSVAMRLQVRDVERSLSASRPADALAPESVRQQLADLEARGALPLDAFRQAAETTERLQRHARETLNDQAPDFSRLTQLLALLPGAVQTTTQEIPSQPQAIQPESAAINNREPVQAEYVAPPANIAAEMTMKLSAEPRQIRDRNDALERLRVIRRWFEHSEPSSPTIPLLRQAERLVGKRFSEVINEIPSELLEKWDALE
ncbi:ImpA family type VI secretion system protein [Escherichia coli]|nr:ImpA family type VI secretion system protein [Escherichia coli]